MADQKSSPSDLTHEVLKHVPGAEPSARIDAMWWLVVESLSLLSY
jgi:hypothetical protein